MHELLSIKGSKQRRTGLRRVIDIAKVCISCLLDAVMEKGADPPSLSIV